MSAIFSNHKQYLGLTASEANKRLDLYGPNSRPAPAKTHWYKRLLVIISEPMILLLLSASAIYFFIGDKIETIILLISIIPILVIEFVHGQKTDTAVSALDKVLVQFASVYRDHTVVKLEVANIVPGDLVYLTAGDKIPADGIIINSPGLMVDESILTGESVSAPKQEAINEKENNADTLLQQGTLVTQGEAKMLVTTTGIKTAYGRLGELLKNIDEQSTPLQKKIRRLITSIAIIAGVVAFTIGIIMGLRIGWANGILSAITMAMSLIPEEFPIVFNVFLIMGVWRMTHKNALVRKMAMVEILGSTTVICTDKTGTLTTGKMLLQKIFYKDQLIEADDLLKKSSTIIEPVTAALLALEQIAIDPMEIEVQRFAKQIHINLENLYQSHELIEDRTFESKTKMVHHLWQDKAGNLRQYSAGAPENIINNSLISDKERARLKVAYESMAAQGYRVIAIATKLLKDNEQIGIDNLEFQALFALYDPPRDGVKEAIQLCQKAGIRIIMITGDNKLTAHNIAEQIGLKHNEELIGETELKNLSPAALEQMVKTHDIFARIKPEEKYLLVEALQKNGEIVAMTGDGVNDAPALKKADIGIAMGERGTEVARAAAGIILTDDNFASIANAVKDGRKIYDNLRQAFVFLLTFHIPIVVLAFFPLFWGDTLIFHPIHIIFLELFCDPAAVLGFEHEKARHNLMNEPPRPSNAPLINRAMIWQIIIQGLGIAVISCGFYIYWSFYQNDIALGRTTAFVSLVFGQILIIFFSREWEQIKSNSLLLIIGLATITAIILIIEIKQLTGIFQFSHLSQSTLIATTIICAIFTFAFARLGRWANRFTAKKI